MTTRPSWRAIAVLAALTLAASASSYTVQRGDTLSQIATQFGVPMQGIVDANGLSNPNHIRVGQVLQIPDGSGGTSAAPAAPGDNRVYVVQPGDSLSKIAKRYGVSVAQLMTANGITDPNRIWVGSRIRIDANAPAGVPAGTVAVVPGVVAGSGGGTYTVRPGDALSIIARNHGVTTAELAAVNGIADANLIKVGQRLVVPGGWSCPVPDVTRFIDDFGAPRAEGRFHEGTDLFAAMGSPVLAPVAGTLEAIEGRIGGKQFRLHGDDGFLYIGSHLSAFGSTGRVAAGELIGQVGDSGSAKGTAPHLHFEIHPKGLPPINPYPTVKAAC